MRCCINCFDAKEPRQTIEDQNEINDCDFCGTEGVPTVEAEDLRELFKPVLEYYEIVEYQKHYLDPDTETLNLGDSLGFLLQQDWGIFSDTLDGSDKCNELIEAIFDDEIEAHDLWCTIDDRWYTEPDEERSAWHKFTFYLKKQRRFLLDFNEAGIDELIGQLSTVLEEIQFPLLKDSIIFRTRLGGKDNGTEIRPYPKANMGAPPSDPNRQGRGNPPGISYLYAASDSETAVAEQRPGRKSLLSLAELKTVKELSLIDLANVSYLNSPFGIEFLAYEIQARRLLGVLGNELSRPVSTEDSPNEYLPSQFLCEFILNSGYDGVIYASGYGPGQNYLIFDTKAAVPKEVRLVEVQDSQVTLEFGTVYDTWEERLE